MALDPARLVGPVLDKELRVASRQRRYYLLRFAYVCLLAFVTVQLWYTMVRVGGGASGVVQVSRLGELGKTAIVTIVWFQFITAQVLAAVLLSDAISSEIRQRTLEGLLVTPIGAVHIVLGKLLSRLFQLVLLLAISLPVLAIARVFGGVPWDYVISGLCITLSASVFAGSLSLYCSITYRHPYQAVLVVALWYLVIWGMFALPVISLSAAGYVGFGSVRYVMSLLNPIAALVTRTQMMLAGAGGPGAPAPLPLHCLTILVAAALILALSVRRVRRISLASTLTHTGRLPRDVGVQEAKATPGGKRREQEIRRVQGAPVVWKEMRTRFFGARRQLLFTLASWVGVAGLVLIVVVSIGSREYGSLFIPITILQWLLIVRLGVAAGGAITREKEARTWPILLATPLSDKEIIQGKLIAALKRNLPVLSGLLLLYLFAAIMGSTYEFKPLLIILSAAIGLAGSIVFLLGVGVYLSMRLKTTGGAVASTLGVYLAPKLFCCGIPGPFLLLMANSAAGSANALFTLTVVTPVVHATAGWLCMRAATRRVRRDIFR